MATDEKLLKDARDLIERQRAEIERLRKRATGEPIGLFDGAIKKQRSQSTSRLPQGAGQFRIGTAKPEARSDAAKRVDALKKQREDGRAEALAEVKKKARI